VLLDGGRPIRCLNWPTEGSPLMLCRDIATCFGYLYWEDLFVLFSVELRTLVYWHILKEMPVLHEANIINTTAIRCIKIPLDCLC